MYLPPTWDGIKMLLDILLKIVRFAVLKVGGVGKVYSGG